MRAREVGSAAHVLPLKLIVAEPDRVKAGALKKHIECDVDRIVALDGERKDVVTRLIDAEIGTNMAANIDILAEKGIMVGYGSVLKPVAELPFLKMMFKNITLSSILVYLLDADEAAAYAAIVGDMLARGALDVPVGHVLPLADAAQAHELVEGNERSGAVILGID